MAAASAVPAKAVLVDYTVTFSGTTQAATGTGTLVLDLPSFPDPTIPYTNLPNPIFSSLTASFGTLTFNLTNSNIAFGGVQGHQPVDATIEPSVDCRHPIDQRSPEGRTVPRALQRGRQCRHLHDRDGQHGRCCPGDIYVERPIHRRGSRTLHLGNDDTGFCRNWLCGISAAQQPRAAQRVSANLGQSRARPPRGGLLSRSPPVTRSLAPQRFRPRVGAVS